MTTSLRVGSDDSVEKESIVVSDFVVRGEEKGGGVVDGVEG